MQLYIPTYIFISFITLSHTRAITEPLCDGAVINDEFFEKQVLLKNINTPSQLAVDHVTNTLYFSYVTTGEKDLYQTGYLDLRTKRFGKVNGITRSNTAVDHKNHKIYMAGAKGIYSVDSKSKVATNLNITNSSVSQLFYKDALYYTTLNGQVFVYKNGTVTQINELSNGKPTMVAVSKNSDKIYFANFTGLYALRNRSEEQFLGKYNVNGFTTDVLGNVFFSTVDGVYNINENMEDIEHVIMSTSNIYGVAMEEDGSFLYSDFNSIIRLKSTKFGIFSGVNPLKARICLSYYDTLKKSRDVNDNGV